MLEFSIGRTGCYIVKRRQTPLNLCLDSKLCVLLTLAPEQALFFSYTACLALLSSIAHNGRVSWVCNLPLMFRYTRRKSVRSTPSASHSCRKYSRMSTKSLAPANRRKSSSAPLPFVIVKAGRSGDGGG